MELDRSKRTDTRVEPSKPEAQAFAPRMEEPDSVRPAFRQAKHTSKEAVESLENGTAGAFEEQTTGYLTFNTNIYASSLGDGIPEQQEKSGERDAKDNGKTNEKHRPYLAAKLDDSQYEAFQKDLGLSRENVDASRKVINEHGMDAKEAVMEAANTKRVRVLGMGEFHPGGEFLKEDRYALASIMPDLKKAGFTDYAAELPTSMQVQLNTFAKRVHDANGDLRQETKLKNDLIVAMAEAGRARLASDDYGEILLQAAKAGLNLHAVDADSGNRNKIMSDNISKILDGNKNARVVFEVGANHLARRDNGGQSAAQNLRQKYHDLSVETFLGIGQFLAKPSNLTKGAPAMLISPDLNRNVAVSTSETGTDSLANMHFVEGSSLLNSEWDHLILYAKPQKASQ